MIIEYKGKKFKTKNTEKIKLAKEKVQDAIEPLIEEAIQSEDEELFLLILTETKLYIETTLNEVFKKLNFETINKYVELEEVRE